MIPSREIGKLPLINALDFRVGLSEKYKKKDQKRKIRYVRFRMEKYSYGGNNRPRISQRARRWPARNKIKKMRDRGRSRREDGRRRRERREGEKSGGKKEEERKARNFNAHKSRKLLSGHYRSPIHALAREPCRTRARLPVRMIPSADRARVRGNYKAAAAEATAKGRARRRRRRR